MGTRAIARQEREEYLLITMRCSILSRGGSSLQAMRGEDKKHEAVPDAETRGTILTTRPTR